MIYKFFCDMQGIIQHPSMKMTLRTFYSSKRNKTNFINNSYFGKMLALVYIIKKAKFKLENVKAVLQRMTLDAVLYGFCIVNFFVKSLRCIIVRTWLRKVTQQKRKQLKISGGEMLLFLKFLFPFNILSSLKLILEILAEK